ncbi:MAG: TolC family protein [Persicimonas sp.]
MRDWKWSLIVAASVVVLGGAAPDQALAQCPVDAPLAPSTVTPAAHQAYAEGQQQAHQALVEGWRRARASVPGRLRSLDATAVPELSTDGDAALNEYTADVVLTLELGQLAEARREHVEALGEQARAEADHSRWEYVFAVQEAYLDWWIAALEVEHLSEYAEEAAADIEPFEAALERERVAALDVADMRAEVARVRAELLEARQRTGRAEARLSELLGGRCRMASVEPRHQMAEQPADQPADQPAEQEAEQMDAALPSDNPWEAVSERVEEFPAVAKLEARRERALAGSREAAAQAPWELSAGLGMRSVGFEEHWVLGVVGLSIPLGNPAAPEADRLQAEAIAARAEGEWQIRQLRAGLQARADQFEATVEIYEALRTEYLGPLDERQAMLDDAVDSGRVNSERVIRARRDLHEAHHKLLMLRTQLHTDQMRAGAMHQWLTTYENPEESP